MTLLSIIIPVYNAKDFLVRCVESAVNKGFDSSLYEILLIDDGSTDGSAEICNKLATLHANLKVVHKKNEGVSIARNTGIELASGKYIAFIDSDDYIETDDFKKILDLCTSKDLDICFYNAKVLDSSGKYQLLNANQLSFDKIYVGEDVILNKYQISSSCTAFYKTKHIKNYSIRFCKDMTHSEDTDFVAHAVVFAQKVMFTNCVPYVYAYNESSATKSSNTCPEKRQRKILSNIIMTQRLKNLALNESISKRMRHYIKKWANSIIVGEFLSIRNGANYAEDIVYFSRHGYSTKVLPIKGGTLSWKTTLVTPIINIIANSKTK